jgi:hypothetical protein
MHATRTPLQVWFWAAYLVATHHPGISAVQLKRQLGIGRYETAWLMLHKLRRAMVAPERGRLMGPVEVDDFYVGGLEEGRGGGRKSDSTKAIVAAAVELRGKGSGRLRLGVIPDLSADSLCGFVGTVVDAGATVHTDAWQGYRRLARLGYDHRPSSQRVAGGRLAAAPRAPLDLQPQGLAARHSPRCLARTPAGLPRRVRLPPQPPPHADGGLSDAALARCTARALDLPRDHPAGNVRTNGTNRIRTAACYWASLRPCLA